MLCAALMRRYTAAPMPDFAPVMNSLSHSFIASVRIINATLGRCLSWLVAAMALTVVSIVIARSAFGAGSVALQESVMYMHGIAFMLCLAYTGQAEGHVRVDIFYRGMSDEAKAWVNACGAVLLLLPFALFLLVISWRFVVHAWAVGEGSNDPGGIPALYLLKTLIPITGVLLALRAASEALQQVLFLSHLKKSP